MKILIGVQILTTVVFAVWLLYVWIKDIDFGSQPSCNHLVKYVIFFADVRATATWLRVLLICYLVISTCSLLPRLAVPFSDHMARLYRKISMMGRPDREMFYEERPKEGALYRARMMIKLSLSLV